MKVGTRLAIAREDRKMNQTEMAELLGVSVPTYSRLERNETSIDLEQVVRFSQKLNIPIQEFLPETISISNNSQSGNSGNIGLVMGTVNYYSDKELQQENTFLKEKIQLLEGKIKDLEEKIDLMKKL